jgi:HK97 gp10 family phage protein
MALKGAKRHIDRLKFLASPLVEKLVTQALFNGAEQIAAYAQLLITAGAVSGKGHIASKPGEPPNNDTGVLADNIEASLYGPLKARVISSAPYSGALEKGSSKVEARPFMRPARDAKKKEVRELVSKAMLVAVKRSTQT